MYPATNRIHFIDPVQDVTADVDRVLVLREFRDSRNGHFNTIVEVKKARHWDGYEHWWITKDGYHVQGAPINPPSLPSYQPVMGIISDDLFVVGTLSQSSNTVARINDSIRSDRRTLGDMNLRVHHTDIWVKAAPWAIRLMPKPADGIQSAAAKLLLAEQLYINRRAYAGVWTKGVAHGYDEDIQSLADEGKIPSPVFGALVKGSAFVPVPDRLRQETWDEVQQATSAVADVNVRLVSYARVDLSFMYPAEAHTREELDASVTGRGVSRHAAAMLGYSDLVVGNTNLTPVLRNLD